MAAGPGGAIAHYITTVLIPHVNTWCTSPGEAEEFIHDELIRVFAISEEDATTLAKQVVTASYLPPHERPMGIIEGFVVDRHHRGLVGARVWITHHPHDIETYTDDHGRYSLEVPATITRHSATKHRVDVEYYDPAVGPPVARPARRLADHKMAAVRQGQEVRLDFEMDTPPGQGPVYSGGRGRIEGTVTNGQNEPIQGAEVRIVELGREVTIRDTNGTLHNINLEATTDSKGQYHIDNVPSSAVAYRGVTRRENDENYVPDLQANEPHHQASGYTVEATAYYHHANGSRDLRTADATIIVPSVGEGEWNVKVPPLVLDIPNVRRYNRAARGSMATGGRALWGMDKEIGSRIRPRGWSDHPRYWAERFKIGGTNVVIPLILLALGVGLAAAFGVLMFILAFLFWALRSVLPEPHDWERESGRTVWQWRDMEHGGNLYYSMAKALFKTLSFLFFGIAFWQFAATSFPFASLIFVVFAFVAYFNLKAQYNPAKPYEFFEGIVRTGIGVIVIPFLIFLSIFNSWPLAILSLAFFATLPTPVQENKGILERAMGRRFASFSDGYESVEKWVFVILMILGGALSFTWGLSGAQSSIFWMLWVVSFVTGFFSPASARCYTGIVMVSVAFLLFAFGPGSDIAGTALFGEWWPTISTTVGGIIKPLTDALSQLQDTFGTGIGMVMCPTCFAHQIMPGTYADNELGLTGAYGVEIESMHADKIYLEELFNIRANLANRGPQHATDIKFRLTSNNQDITVGTAGGTALRDLGERDKYGKPLYSYDLTLAKNELSENDIEPLYLYGKISCGSATQLLFKGMKGTERRDVPINFKMTVNYTYKVSSVLQMTFISEDEWKQRTKSSELQLKSVKSSISTSPVKLSIDAMEQPIQETAPFFIAFNITPEERNGIVGDATVELEIPKEFGTPKECTYPIKTSGSRRPTTKPDKPTTLVYESQDKYYLYWFLDGNRKYVFCFFDHLAIPKIGAPEKTYTIMAESEFEFSKSDDISTLIAFDDACAGVAAATTGSELYSPADCSTTQTDLSTGTVVLSEMPDTYKASITKDKIQTILDRCGKSDDFKKLAQDFYDLGMTYDIDPAFVAAVAALESGWGSSPISSSCKNLFNINYEGAPYTSCPGNSRYVQYLTYRNGIDVFCDSLIMKTYVGKYGQKTPAQITCATWSGVTDHCYCCDVISERDAWADQVAAIRAKFQVPDYTGGSIAAGGGGGDGGGSSGAG